MKKVITRITTKPAFTKKQLKRKRVSLLTKQGEKVEVFDVSLNKFLRDVRRGDFTKVTIEVEREGVVCTYETPKGSGTVVLYNIYDK